MTTAARPGQFTGATDNSANGGLFGDTKIDGIPDLVGADVLAAQVAAAAAKVSETNAGTSETNADAEDVPFKTAYSFPAYALITLTPGAAISTPSPKLEKVATLPVEFKAETPMT